MLINRTYQNYGCLSTTEQVDAMLQGNIDNILTLANEAESVAT